MITVSGGQMAALDEAAYVALAGRMWDRDLRREVEIHRPGQPLEPYRARLLDLARRARSLGLRSEADVGAFLSLALVRFERLADQPEFKAVLADPAVNPNARMMTLVARISPLRWHKFYTGAPPGSLAPGRGDDIP